MRGGADFLFRFSLRFRLESPTKLGHVNFRYSESRRDDFNRPIAAVALSLNPSLLLVQAHG